MELKQRTYQQARRQAIWAGLWMVVAVGAMIARPGAASPRQWLVDQALLLSGMLMLFQLGRMFQSLTHVRSLSAEGASANPLDMPGLEGEFPAGMPSDVPAHVWIAREVRAYASVDEAERNGWEFTDPVARFGDKPVPSHARFLGRLYAYDGLTTDAILRALPQDRRVFGRLLYKQMDQDPPLSSEPMITQ